MNNLSEKTKITLTTQNLSESQWAAAAERARNVVVTAGAGSGKTRTLVARYLGLLADGLQPDKVVAITFTEKAANEMRARVRIAIRDQIVQARNLEEHRFWMGLEQQIDAARIGTIHSLCAEILRNHPAEARIDPLFKVLEEGEATIALVETIETALVNITQEEKYQPLFALLRVNSLTEILTQMMKKRLELQPWLENKYTFEEVMKIVLQPFVENDEIRTSVEDLKSFSPQFLQNDTTAKGVEQVYQFLAGWKEFVVFWKLGDFQQCLDKLISLRFQVLNRLVGGNQSQSKMHLTGWRGIYDEKMGWIGKEFNPELEQKIADAIPLLKEAFTVTLQLYHQSLSNQRALDFDDLEYRALALLKQPEIAQKWQEKVQALLVDEFQDTNQRQRKLIEALSAQKPGGLFVVGDARQSIYRFRGADVSIFKEIQRKVIQNNGLVSDLAESHRTHAGLMNAMDAILSPIMGDAEIPEKNFHVPFRKMIPMRKNLPNGVQKPFIEVLIGAGSDSEEGRLLAANLLAEQLFIYKQAGQIQDWKDVALLFRASGAFPIYEQALEAAGIPYVTIAGSGFYDRPEIRDILNLLRTLADPWDDLAMVGFLRSPSIGMSDHGITQLRWSQSENEPMALRLALEKDGSYLSHEDQQAVERAKTIFSEFGPLVGLIPVAALLQKLMNHSQYRVLMAGTIDRGWRNIDKLILDAYNSQQSSIHAYLEYVQRIRDTGVREGEAAGAAEDAIQLMTIHKSKGLEFPWVVLADAGRKPNVNKDRWLVSDQWLAFNSDREEYTSLLTRFLKELETEKEKAESKRLLYVALTRAKDKLLISGHFSQYKDKFTVNGWLKEILDLSDLDPDLLTENLSQEAIPLPGGAVIGIHIRKELVEFPAQVVESQQEQRVRSGPLLAGLASTEPEMENGKVEVLDQVIFGQSDQFPLWVGKLLHMAVQRWEFRNAQELRIFLERSALRLGILDSVTRNAAIDKAKLLMERLQAHPLYEEINSAERRYHEIPYETWDEVKKERGRLDILYQTENDWKIIDFKTDQLNSFSNLPDERKMEYKAQLLRYQNSVYQQLKVKPSARFCFLNLGAEIELYDLDEI